MVKSDICEKFQLVKTVMFARLSSDHKMISTCCAELFKLWAVMKKPTKHFQKESFEKLLKSTSFAAPSDFVGNVG